MRALMNSQFHYTFFFSKENVECSTFLKSLDAFQKPNEYGLLIQKKNSFQAKKSEKVQILPKEYHHKFIELHDAIFPDVYISGKEIISDIGKNHYVFTIIENDQIKAYSILFLRGNPRATAEIIGVHHDFRHQGYGRTVLSHLIYSAFNDFGLEAVDLIVDSDNAYALNLYLKIGFTIEFENHCYLLA
jgi:GNAT superfamily N-acetyltransferase